MEPIQVTESFSDDGSQGRSQRNGLHERVGLDLLGGNIVTFSGSGVSPQQRAPVTMRRYFSWE